MCIALQLEASYIQKNGNNNAYTERFKTSDEGSLDPFSSHPLRHNSASPQLSSHTLRFTLIPITPCAFQSSSLSSLALSLLQPSQSSRSAMVPLASKTSNAGETSFQSSICVIGTDHGFPVHSKQVMKHDDASKAFSGLLSLDGLLGNIGLGCSVS